MSISKFSRRQHFTTCLFRFTKRCLCFGSISSDTNNRRTDRLCSIHSLLRAHLGGCGRAQRRARRHNAPRAPQTRMRSVRPRLASPQSPYAWRCRSCPGKGPPAGAAGRIRRSTGRFRSRGGLSKDILPEASSSTFRSPAFMSWHRRFYLTPTRLTRMMRTDRRRCQDSCAGRACGRRRSERTPPQ